MGGGGWRRRGGVVSTSTGGMHRRRGDVDNHAVHTSNPVVTAPRRPFPLPLLPFPSLPPCCTTVPGYAFTTWWLNHAWTPPSAQVLPRVQALGYNAIQLMAIQEHAYYGSFGYHGGEGRPEEGSRLLAASRVGGRGGGTGTRTGEEASRRGKGRRLRDLT